MEVNKDEALRCLEIARRHLNTGNFAHARKFGLKSISLFPTTDAKAFIAIVESKEAMAARPGASSSTPGASTPSSTKGSSNPGVSTSASSGPKSPSPPLRSRSTPIIDHKPVEREYTAEQVAAVKAIRSSGGDFYKVLGVKKDATEIEIKKAYRKVALQMHPDKNGAPGADEAFKIVSKAFTVLSDSQKRAIFDQHGPDEGKSSSVNYDRERPAAQQYGFRGAGGGYGEDISPEDLFNMFFGGGSFGGGSFGSSFHSSTFGGSGQRARSRAQQTQYHQQRQQQHRQQHQQQRQRRQQQQQQQNEYTFDLSNGIGSMIHLLPLILLLIVSLTSGLFSPESSSSSSSSKHPATMDFSLRPKDSFTTARHTTSTRNVPYFVNENRFMNTYFPGQQVEFRTSSARQMNVSPDHVTSQGKKVYPLFRRMEENVESAFLRDLQYRCREERRRKEVAQNKAVGFWGADPVLWKEAQRMPLPSCDVIKEKWSRYKTMQF
ncbi:hypothetical protein BG011_000018 [Mortierella polycephala]|uniref:J domain-containing protein n=1 Tax=Mortierella polycephala TaxID=41804 RepID=A0A9P6QI77_9FUNG|nr:hypothetical protein BG011_000018 [Mortierella polycephala]